MAGPRSAPVRHLRPPGLCPAFRLDHFPAPPGPPPDLPLRDRPVGCAVPDHPSARLKTHQSFQLSQGLIQILIDQHGIKLLLRLQFHPRPLQATDDGRFAVGGSAADAPLQFLLERAA